jgi:hypothetical protein
MAYLKFSVKVTCHNLKINIGVELWKTLGGPHFVLSSNSPQGAQRSTEEIREFAAALVLSYSGKTFVLTDVLAKGAYAAFLLANRQFQLSVQAVDGFEVLGTEHVHQEGRYLGQIAEDIFHLATEAIEFGAFAHWKLNSVSRGLLTLDWSFVAAPGIL